MNLKKKYLKWIGKNISSDLKEKEVIAIGATGSLSRFLCYYLAYRKNNITIVGRNNKLLEELKTNLIEINNNIKVTILNVDFNDIKSIDNLINSIKDNKYDVLFNGIGIFYQPIEIVNDIDKTFKVNYLSYVYFFDNLLQYENFKSTRIVLVDSISYRFQKVTLNDIQKLNIKNQMKRYGNTKLLLAHYSIKLINDGYNVILCHPGVVATNLFSSKSNNFNKLLIPIMKLIFMKEDKAALCFLKACDKIEHDTYEWVGPRGLLHTWGYPNIQRLNKKYVNELMIESIYLNSIKLLDKINY